MFLRISLQKVSNIQMQMTGYIFALFDMAIHSQ